jgi:hypothetical protein
MIDGIDCTYTGSCKSNYRRTMTAPTSYSILNFKIFLDILGKQTVDILGMDGICILNTCTCCITHYYHINLLID